MSNEIRKAARVAQLDRWALDLKANTYYMSEYASHELEAVLDHIGTTDTALVEQITAELDSRADSYYSDQYAGDGIFADNH